MSAQFCGVSEKVHGVITANGLSNEGLYDEKEVRCAAYSNGLKIWTQGLSEVYLSDPAVHIEGL